MGQKAIIMLGSAINATTKESEMIVEIFVTSVDEVLMESLI